MSIEEYLNGARRMATNVFGRRDEYLLEFQKEEDGLWYLVYPGWPFDHHNLLMVSGSDNLCELLSDDGRMVKVSVIPAKKHEVHEGYFELEQTEHSLTGGSTYKVDHDEFRRRFHRDTIWICPVTLFVLGYYPKYIYIKKID